MVFCAFPGGVRLSRRWRNDRRRYFAGLQAGEDFLDSGFDGDAVLLTEDRDSPVLDELVGPADADDRGFDALVGQMLDDG